MNAIDDVLREKCYKLVRAIAPELDPLYILRSDEFERRLHASGCMGWALAGLRTTAFADVLGQSWQGPGSLIVLDADAISGESQPGQFERCVFNTVVHEAAHLVPVLELPELRQEDLQAPALKNWALQQAEQIAASADPEPGSQRDAHDWKFLRHCCHLFYRACAAGFDIPMFRIFGSQEWLTRPEIYLAFVLGECVKLAREPFKAIEAVAPPAGFMELWDADLHFYKTQFQGKQVCSKH